MADYHYANGAATTNRRGRFGRRFQSWGISDDGIEPWSDSALLTKAAAEVAGHDHVCRPVVIGSDGRAKPVVLDRPPRSHKDPIAAYHNFYEDEAAAYDINTNITAAASPTLIHTGGWTRPSSTGWKLPPDVAPLGKDINSAEIATEFLRESAAARLRKRFSVAAATIDSREAAKKYGGQFIW